MRESTSEVGRSAMRKALWRIVPLIALAYLCAYTDRVNVGFAAARMNADLGFSATVYGLGGGLFFLGYALFEVPSNLTAMRYGSRTWLARIIEDGRLEAFRQERYAGWQGETGKAVHAPGATLASIADIAIRSNRAPEPRSGRQEWLANLINQL